MRRTLASLNPQEALHVAIFIEERNAGIYHRFAGMFTEFRDPDSLEIASVFWDMAVEERRHSTALQEKYQERYGNAGCALTEEDPQDMIEVPRLDDGDVFADLATAQDSARERAVKVALAAEQSAQNYYSRLAEQTKDTHRGVCTTNSLLWKTDTWLIWRTCSRHQPARTRECIE
jgi:rubrerythrin